MLPTCAQDVPNPPLCTRTGCEVFFGAGFTAVSLYLGAAKAGSLFFSLLKNPDPKLVRETRFPLKTFVKDPELRAFYEQI